jgi:hypothetical protein
MKALKIIFGCLLGFAGAKTLTDHWTREQMSRELDNWNQEEWKQDLLDARVREFMDQMERKHL